MKRLVLVGAGHAHAQVLLDWATRPVPGVELVVVSPYALAPYSGMVPGWLAGTYTFDDIAIDFVALCQHAGARWVLAHLDRLDPDQQTLHLDNGDTLSYDWLSLNVGSTLTPPVGTWSAQMLTMRPLASLRAHYEPTMQVWKTDPGTAPGRVAAIGGGAAGLESLLAVLSRMRQLRPDRTVQGTLVTRASDLLQGYPSAVQRMAHQALRDAGVTVQLQTAWSDAIGNRHDLVLWATGAQAHAWQRDGARRGSLAVSDAGFVMVDAYLRSTSHPRIFAVGDAAQWAVPLPKAGVYAVRMGPVLLDNLRASLSAGAALRAYQPQSTFLSLLATSDGRAIASRGGFSGAGRWAWWLKNRIDRGFVERFKVPQQG